MFNQLHNFVKSNYQQGVYSVEKQADYTIVKDSAVLTDYQLGYRQAQADYQRNQTFRYYPSYLVNFSNRVANNRFSEINTFLKGYRDAKRKLLNKKKPSQK